MFELFHERSKATDDKLLALAGTKAACLIGCQFCLDIGSHISREAGVTEEQLRSLHAYRDSPAFSPLERLVLEYAEEMCQMPVVDLGRAVRAAAASSSPRSRSSS